MRDEKPKNRIIMKMKLLPALLLMFCMAACSNEKHENDEPVPGAGSRLEGVGFAFYGLDISVNEAPFREIVKSDYCNTFFVVGSHHTMDVILAGLREIDKNKKTAWLNVAGSFYTFYGTHTVLNPDWKKNISTIMDKIEEEGLMGSVRGIYFDEPFLWKIDKESFMMVTKYFRETYTGKGIFVCFSVAEISPQLWKPEWPVVELDQEIGKYLTDVAYDYYADAQTEKQAFNTLTADMKRRMGRDDFKIWFVPCTMSYLGKTDEAYSIEHVNSLYRRLKIEKNPGGLACYTYYTIPKEIEPLGNIGLDQLLAPDNVNRWNNLDRLLQAVGKEIMAGQGN